MIKKLYRIILDTILFILALDFGLLNYFRFSNKGGIHGNMESWFKLSTPLYTAIIITALVIAISGFLIGITDYRQKLNKQKSLALKTLFFLGVVLIEFFLYSRGGKG